MPQAKKYYLVDEQDGCLGYAYGIKTARRAAEVMLDEEQAVRIYIIPDTKNPPVCYDYIEKRKGRKHLSTIVGRKHK